LILFAANTCYGIGSGANVREKADGVHLQAEGGYVCGHRTGAAALGPYSRAVLPAPRCQGGAQVEPEYQGGVPQGHGEKLRRQGVSGHLLVFT